MGLRPPVRPGDDEEPDTFAVAETKQEANAVGAGDLSVHEVDPDLFENDLMHLSYYAAGYRALRVVPERRRRAPGGGGGLHRRGRQQLLGRAPDRGPAVRSRGRDAVLLSDRDFGLYVVQHTG